MQTTVLTEVYALLKTIRAVANEAKFSRDWLGRSESYVSGLRFKGLGASTSSLASCSIMGCKCVVQLYTGSLASSSWS